MAFNLPPPPVSNNPSDPSFRDWFYKLQKYLGDLVIAFVDLDFTGSNITSIETRNHEDLQNLNTANYTHLTATQATDLTDGGDSTLHFHASDRALANATGVLGFVNGGTGLSALGTASQVLAVNAGATALEYVTPSSAGRNENVLLSNLTIEADTSYVVVGYFNPATFTLTVNGNMAII